MSDFEPLWGPDELSRFLGRAPGTIRADLSRAPEKLPPRVAAMSQPRWVPEIVKAWAIKQSTPRQHRGGRPRG